MQDRIAVDREIMLWEVQFKKRYKKIEINWIEPMEGSIFYRSASKSRSYPMLLFEKSLKQFGKNDKSLLDQI